MFIAMTPTVSSEPVQAPGAGVGAGVGAEVAVGATGGDMAVACGGPLDGATVAARTEVGAGAEAEAGTESESSVHVGPGIMINITPTTSGTTEITMVAPVHPFETTHRPLDRPTHPFAFAPCLN
jgi:hypothetical protein